VPSPVLQARSPTPPLPPPDLPQPVVIETEPDTFGLYRSYTTYPIHDPNEQQGIDDVCDAPGLAIAPNPQSSRWWSGFGSESVIKNAENSYAPFLNATVFKLMHWFYNGSLTKSLADLDSLVHDVLLADDFDSRHLENFSAARELKRLDAENESFSFSKENGWWESSVKIRLPAEKVKNPSEADAPEFEVGGIYHRNPIDSESVIKTAFQDISAKAYHFTPFQLFLEIFT
jgi:hypothetical protein